MRVQKKKFWLMALYAYRDVTPARNLTTDFHPTTSGSPNLGSNHPIRYGRKGELAVAPQSMSPRAELPVKKSRIPVRLCRFSRNAGP